MDLPHQPLPPVPLWLDLTAIGLGALAASTVAEDVQGQGRGRRLDWLGVAILGIAVGLGGGILRDLLLGIRPVAMTSNIYLAVAATAALVGMLLGRLLEKVNVLVTLLDAIALGVFCVVGTAKAISFGLDPLPIIMLGTVTAAGGGAVRDVLLRLPVGVLYAGTFYAAAAAIGATAFVVMDAFGAPAIASMIACAVVTAGIRMASWRWGLSLPEQLALRLPDAGRLLVRRRPRAHPHQEPQPQNADPQPPSSGDHQPVHPPASGENEPPLPASGVDLHH